MAPVPGGPFWVGALRGRGADEERPRFKTELAPFCVDVTEVTVAQYRQCVAQEKCTPTRGRTVTCNGQSSKRDDHPINCVDFGQATAFCGARGARLPSEIEWEFVARGGEEYRPYPWGAEPPDGNTCWKKPHSCPVGTHTVGAFGLHDVSGNVWEWVDDWFAPYPWPAQSGRTRIYRGGSWSRRFEKWMRPTLRNRFGPDRFGAHLGFRCAILQAGASCPGGFAPHEGRCPRVVTDVECEPPLTWNGARCARAGEPQCLIGTHLVPGHGCELDDRPRATATAQEDGTDPVRRARSPEFDADCAEHQPTRPRAYRLEGGSHVARNQAGKAASCKNRDVGVGWNSACCP